MSDVASLFPQEKQFLDAALQAIETNTLDRLILSQYRGELENLEKITFRMIQLQSETVLNALYRYKTNDVTKNYPMLHAKALISDLLLHCKQSNLFSQNEEGQVEELQLKKNKKKAMLTKSSTQAKVKEQALGRR